MIEWGCNPRKWRGDWGEKNPTYRGYFTPLITGRGPILCGLRMDRNWKKILLSFNMMVWQLPGEVGRRLSRNLGKRFKMVLMSWAEHGMRLLKGEKTRNENKGTMRYCNCRFVQLFETWFPFFHKKDWISYPALKRFQHFRVLKNGWLDHEVLCRHHRVASGGRRCWGGLQTVIMDDNKDSKDDHQHDDGNHVNY